MYPVTDMQRALAFYRDGLGLKPGDMHGDYWVEFDIAGATFGIGNFEQVGKPGTANSLAIEIANLDDYRKSLTARGIDATEPHELQACRISMVRDPDGNTIWLHEKKG